MADIHDLFGNDDNANNGNIHDLFNDMNNDDSSEKPSVSATSFTKMFVENAKGMFKQEFEMKISILENGLRLYKDATKGVDMANAQMVNTKIPSFIQAPLVFTIKAAAGDYLHLFDEEVDGVVYSFCILPKIEANMTKVDENHMMMASSISLHIMKTDGENISVYDPESKEWMPAEAEMKKKEESVEENADLIKNISDEIKNIIEDKLDLSEYVPSDFENKVYKENGPAAYLLACLEDEDVKLNDEEYELLFKNKDKLINLYSHVSESMKFELDVKYGVVLIPRDIWHMGFAVTYEDGYFELLQYFDESTVEMLSIYEGNESYCFSIAKTKSVKVVLDFIRKAINAKRGKKASFTIPISKDSFVCAFGTSCEDVSNAVIENMENNVYNEEEMDNLRNILAYILSL